MVGSAEEALELHNLDMSQVDLVVRICDADGILGPDPIYKRRHRSSTPAARIPRAVRPRAAWCMCGPPNMLRCTS